MSPRSSLSIPLCGFERFTINIPRQSAGLFIIEVIEQIFRTVTGCMYRDNILEEVNKKILQNPDQFIEPDAILTLMYMYDKLYLTIGQGDKKTMVFSFTVPKEKEIINTVQQLMEKYQKSTTSLAET